jgi:hypothetical protein
MLAGPIGLLPDGVSLYYGQLTCSSYRTLMVQVLAAIIIPLTTANAETQSVSGWLPIQISDIENPASRDRPRDSRLFGARRPRFPARDRVLHSQPSVMSALP